MIKFLWSKEYGRDLAGRKNGLNTQISSLKREGIRG
jgi:hypothetical protein